MINLIFDYDGTLHNSIRIYSPAFREVYEYLVTLEVVKSRDWTDEEISVWLGYSSVDMWNTYLPQLPQALKDTCSKRLGELMLQYVNAGKAKLYPHSIEVLETLCDKGYQLIFLSNCKHAYMQAHIEKFQLDRYFINFFCSEDYNFIPKHEIYLEIKQKYGEHAIVIGDRFQDMEISINHGLPSIGCAYGYGKPDELTVATRIANDIRDIPRIVEELS
ncbi:MAG TPA: HAD family hydrolase [Lachnospiraceae bacterium]|nr:HAD family hydrolase [Lachnospiraceae bacterium]